MNLSLNVNLSLNSFIQQLHSKIVKLAALPSKFLRSSILDDSMFPPVGFLTPEKVRSLERALNVPIVSVPYFEQALTHRSYLQVLQNPHIFSNERLEFFGDAILSAVIAEYLFYLRSDVQEGELTKMRSWLVNKKSLAYCARKLCLDEFIMVSLSARNSLQQGNDSILADALEAIIAAIYLDSGAETAKEFIIRSVLLHVMNEASLMRDTNFKSILLEHAQAIGAGTPQYVVVSADGPDHRKNFAIEVLINGVVVGRGSGRSKKDAEQDAAKDAVEKIASGNVVLGADASSDISQQQIS
ncbi:MAG: ribonuclease III [Bacteroidota bacterium]|nr:ribonuclease III [Candidatus Kapabacteria bacterium]MDW8220716.1 ribonuclease III [Bacteroidota bacterium]